MSKKARTKRKALTSAEEAGIDAIDPDRVESMSRDELLSLARRLVLDRSTNRGGFPRRPPVDPDAVTSSVAAALHDEWEPRHHSISREVGGHTDRARSDLREKRWEEAIRGAVGIVNGFAEGYEPEVDSEGMVTYDLHEAIEIVDVALKHGKAGELRGQVFDAFMGLWWADIGHGGIGLSGGVPDVLRKHANKAEKARLASEVRERLPGEASSAFRREAASKLFLALGGDRLNDTAYLEFCRDNGLHMERVERLLRLGRAEEAARAADDIPHYRLTEAADLLVMARHPPLAVAVVRDRLHNPDARAFYDRFKEWLERRAERANDLSQARQLAWERFRERPGLGTYTSLRRVARRIKSWSTDEQEALAVLRQPELGDVLTEVHLAERRVAEALVSLKTVTRRFPNDWNRDNLKRRVAHAAQKEFPEAARDLYLNLADSLIARKTRSSYARAAPWVKVACALDKRVRGGRTRTDILHELRRHHGGLPALWDELRKAGVEVPP